MEETLLSRMGKLSSLRNYNIRFNPKPWSNPQHIEWVKPPETKTLKTTKTPKVPNKIKKPKAKKVPKVKTTKQEKSFVDLHLEVASKVDSLLAQMEAEGRFEDTPAAPEQEIGIKPDSTTKLGETILRK